MKKLFLVHYYDSDYNDIYEEVSADNFKQANEMFKSEHEEEILGVYLLYSDITSEDALTNAPEPVMSLHDMKHSLNTILEYHNKNLTHRQYESLLCVSANIEMWIRKLDL